MERRFELRRIRVGQFRQFSCRHNKLQTRSIG
ncbi:hypothetical protein B4U80_06026 [Leptotrombidium deliense]|uniref:Uncharacterized protein n=1 Tax=Leptotrombidium deliense TaxID=299467 RepID=A0A443SLH3_9ACAR|nr:hypothetical protein B4U80_06026 [Leptotrombidium deliense]